MRRRCETVQEQGDGNELDQLRRRFVAELEQAQRCDQREQRAVGDRARVVDRIGFAAEGEGKRLRRFRASEVIRRIPGERKREREKERERDARGERGIEHRAQQANEDGADPVRAAARRRPAAPPTVGASHEVLPWAMLTM